MQLYDSHELYQRLESLSLLKKKPPMWWPGYGTFEVIVGAILTQNSQWTRVEISLQNLRSSGLLDLHALYNCDREVLMDLIQPSGLFKSKANYLQLLSGAVIERFGDFGTFHDDADREWLLQCKGVGKETADSILCYACERPVMVVDAYTARLLSALGFKFEAYDDLQAWCSLADLFAEEELPKAYARFHGMIVEYVKANSKAKVVKIDKIFQG